MDENVLFCSNCGKKLPPHEAGVTEPLTEEKRPTPEKPSKAEPSHQKKKRNKKTSKKPARVVEDPPAYDGYDGYYDDVQPPDLDREKDGLDKELIKKIVALSIGVVFIITMCVVMMYVL